MKRILHIIGGMDRAGAETFLRNICLNVNPKKYSFSILTFLPPRNGERYDYQDELEKNGVFFYHIKDRRFTNPIAFYCDIVRIVRKNNFSIVHSHNDLMSGFFLSAAKRGGAKTLISHAHSASNPNISSLPKALIAKILRWQISRLANIKIACGKAAGDFLFKDSDYKIIPNGIDTNAFKYNYSKRQEIRKALNIKKDSFVLINVARFDIVKNQSFLIRIFDEIAKKRDATELLFVGNGTLEQELKQEAKACAFRDHIHFLGNQTEVQDFYSAADLFLLPSLFEGLPTVCIEAQANGLRCVLSDTVSREAILLPTSKAISLKNKEAWINTIISSPLRDKKTALNPTPFLQKLDIKVTALDLENVYDSI